MPPGNRTQWAIAGGAVSLVAVLLITSYFYLLARFIGLEVSSEDVRMADAFCRGVLIAAGWPALLRLWDDPENTPTDAELAEPAVWLARVAA